MRHEEMLAPNAAGAGSLPFLLPNSMRQDDSNGQEGIRRICFPQTLQYA